jgi:hypothetical protein
MSLTQGDSMPEKTIGIAIEIENNDNTNGFDPDPDPDSEFDPENTFEKH